MIKKSIFSGLLITILLLIVTIPLFSDEREENIDVFLVLDKSLSMEQEISAVKEYVNNHVIDDLLIPGDMFIVIAFYGKAKVIIREEKVEPDENDELKRQISDLLADGHFTDIGNALDKLRSTLAEYDSRDRQRYMLLLTDGIQEAPEDSKYYSPDGSFNHAFLENARTIKQAGWKIQVLGIGTSSAAEEVARQLAGEYAETSEEPTKEEIEEKTKEFLGTMNLVGSPELEPVGKDGSSQITMTIESSGYSQARTVNIRNIQLDIEEGASHTLLSENFTFTIAPDSSKTVTIPVAMPTDLEPGMKTGRISFSFAGKSVFSPAVTSVEFKVKNFLENNIWIIPVGIIVLAAIVIGIILLAKKQSYQKGISFRLYVDNAPLSAKPFTIKPDQTLYLINEGGALSLSQEKSSKAVAIITTDNQGLQLRVNEEAEAKAMDEIPEDVMGEKIRLRMKGGYKTLLFRTA